MYHYECDWCGEPIKVEKEPFVKASITLVTTKRRDYSSKREEYAEPTRFFHAHDLRSVDEFDRLGIEVKHESLGDCCYTRALRQIEGVAPDTPPDMGLEWRLVPINEPQGEAAARDSVNRLSTGPDAELEDFLATLSPSWKTRIGNALQRAKVSTLDQLALLSPSEITRISEMGFGTFQRLMVFIEERERARHERAPVEEVA